MIRSELTGGASMRKALADLLGLGGPEVDTEDVSANANFFEDLLAESMEVGGLDAKSRRLLLSHGEECLWWPVVHAAQSQECTDDAFDALLQWTVNEGPLTPHQGAQALHHAARLGLPRRVRSLLGAGVDPNGHTFLGSAVVASVPCQKSDGALEALSIILQAGDFRGQSRATLVNEALSFGNRRAVELLLDEEDEALAKALVDQHGVLGHALIYGEDVDTAGLEPRSDAEDCYFYVAASLDRLDMVSRDLPGREHQYGRVLELAAGAGSTAVLGWCLDRPLADEQLQEALASAASHRSGPSMELLLDTGAVPSDDTIADASGDAARVLARRGLAIDAAGDDGYTMLLFAAESGDHELVSFLLEQGADPNARTEGIDSTALGSAASMEWARCVDILLQYGADPMIMDLDGDRPVDRARSQYLKDRLTRPMD